MKSGMPVQKAETLLEYAVVDLGQLQNQTVDAIAQTVAPVPTELRGRAPIFLLLQLFVRLRSLVPEITWRPSAGTDGGDQPAIVVFSHLGDEYLRPSDVLDPADWWSEEELDRMQATWEQEKHDALEIDFTTLWETAQDHEETRGEAESLRVFLRHIYSLNPTKRSVAFSGEAPPAACLIALNWFVVGGTKEISYNGQSVL